MTRPAPLLIAVAWLASTAGMPGAVAAEVSRSVAASGYGEVRAAPDRATVSLGMSVHAPTIAAARAAVNKVVPAILALARDLKVPDANVHATAIEVSPEYSWNKAETARHLIGYRIDRRTVIELTDVERLGELLEKSVSLGAVLFNGPQLDSSHRGDLEREELARAVADTKRNAEVIALAAGGAVGAPHELSMAGTHGPLDRDKAVYANASLGPPPPKPQPQPQPEAGTYRVGEMTFSADVEASVDLLPGAAAH